MPVHPWSAESGPRLRNEVLAGRYRLDALLGRGGAADVHEGFDLRLERPVAVKVFRTAGEARPEEERFSEEAFLQARLQHPGLVTVYDSGREEGTPFLVMELIKGPTLRARISGEGGGALSPAEVGVLGAALARALAHVHAAGVVHCDVKPSNILIDETGAPHLADFGIARPADDTVRTAPGVLTGTAAYLAPEQVMGREVGPAADVYALGLTLLECLKGELEYAGAPLEAAIARLHRPPVVPAFLDGGPARLLTAMTAQDERERPDAHTCAEALAAMSEEGALGGLPAGASGAHPAGGAPAPVFPVHSGSFGPSGASGVSRPSGPSGVSGVPGPSVSSGVFAPVGTAAAAYEAPAVRRRDRRTLVTVGAALTTLLGVALTGSIGGLPGHGTDAAPGAVAGHEPAGPAAEPSGTPSAPSDAEARPGPGAPLPQDPQDPQDPRDSPVPQERTLSSVRGVSSVPSASAREGDAARDRVAAASARTGPEPRVGPGKHEAPTRTEKSEQLVGFEKPVERGKPEEPGTRGAHEPGKPEERG